MEKQNKYNKIVESLLNINFEININIFTKTKFNDDDVERKFQDDRYIKEKSLIIFSDVLINIGYFTHYFYILLAYYQNIYFLLCLICHILTLLSIILKRITASEKIKSFCEHLIVFFSPLLFALKTFILLFYFIPETKSEAQLIRTLIYIFVSTNIFICLKFEAIFAIYFLYFLFYLGLFLLAFFHSIKENNYYFIDAITCLFYTSMIFGFRKVWDYNSRETFAEKYKFKRYYTYTLDFITGLNCFHSNIFNNELIFIDENFQNEINNLFEKNSQIKEGSKLIYNNENLNVINKIYSNHELINKTNRNSNGSNIISKLRHIWDIIACRSKKNKIMKNEKEKDSFILKDKQNLNLTNQELLIKNDNLNEYLDKQILFDNFTKNLILYKEENICINSQRTLENDKERIIENSLYTDLTKIMSENFNSISFNNKDMASKISSSIEISNKINKKGNKTNKILKEYKLRKFSIINSKDENEIIKFIDMGIYTFNDSNLKKFYRIYYRKITFDKNSLFFDLLFFEVSENILYKKTIEEQSQIKQKVLAKLAHEFKTPINSIIGLINNIKENLNISEENEQEVLKLNNNNIKKYDKDENHKKKIENNHKINLNFLNIIQTLSNYVIFLVKDIIEFSTLNDLKDINLNIDNIDIRDFASFSIEILNSLLKCHKSKSENILTELIYDENIDCYEVLMDEIRLKQIILNFISNSVKFTKRGKIILNFICDTDKNLLLISLKDSGIGIKDEDKDKIFKDFVMLNNGKSLNSQGSGLGLSICKSLAKKMNINIDFVSIYGEGTEFKITIPVKKHNYQNKRKCLVSNFIKLNPYPIKNMTIIHSSKNNDRFLNTEYFRESDSGTYREYTKIDSRLNTVRERRNSLFTKDTSDKKSEVI